MKDLSTYSQEQRDRVEALAGLGAREDDIAAELQIPPKRLKKNFRRELARGSAVGKHQVLQKLFDAVHSGSNLNAMVFWVKARCGWRDTGSAPQSPEVVRSQLIIATKRIVEE